jgi:hypothetical protein
VGWWVPRIRDLVTTNGCAAIHSARLGWREVLAQLLVASVESVTNTLLPSQPSGDEKQGSGARYIVS